MLSDKLAISFLACVGLPLIFHLENGYLAYILIIIGLTIDVPLKLLISSLKTIDIYELLVRKYRYNIIRNIGVPDSEYVEPSSPSSVPVVISRFKRAIIYVWIYFTLSADYNQIAINAFIAVELDYPELLTMILSKDSSFVSILALSRLYYRRLMTLSHSDEVRDVLTKMFKINANKLLDLSSGMYTFMAEYPIQRYLLKTFDYRMLINNRDMFGRLPLTSTYIHADDERCILLLLRYDAEIDPETADEKSFLHNYIGTRKDIIHRSTNPRRSKILLKFNYPLRDSRFAEQLRNYLPIWKPSKGFKYVNHQNRDRIITIFTLRSIGCEPLIFAPNELMFHIVNMMLYGSRRR